STHNSFTASDPHFISLISPFQLSSFYSFSAPMSSNSTTTNNSSSGTQSTLSVDAGDSNLITINPAAQLSLKLTTTNFPSWRAQIFTLLMGLDFLGYPDGTLAAPSKTIGDAPNPAYNPWFRPDKLLLHAIFAFVSESILSYIVVVVTANEAWVILEKMFANRFRSRLMMQKNDQSVATNLQKIKNLAAELSLVQCPVPEEDLVIHVLRGLGPEYKEFFSCH
ncbi:unnamed protein product, partial [Linum tenue]